MRRFYAILTLVFAACFFSRSATITGPIYLAYSNRPYSGQILLRPLSTPLPNTPNLVTGGDFKVSTDTNGTFSVELQPGNYRVTVGADRGFTIDVPNDTNTYTLLSRITNSLSWNSQVYPYTNIQSATSTEVGVVKTYSTQSDPVVFTTGDIDALSDLIGGGGGGSTKLDATNGVAVNLSGTVTQDFKPDSKASRSWGTDAPYLYSTGDSFTFGASATSYANGYVQKLAASLGLPATNVANGSFTISDATWATFSGWTVTNTTGPTDKVFSSPSSITEDQNWTVLVGFNDIRTTGTTAEMYRKGLDHLLHWLSIPSSAKRTAQAPDASTGTWTAIPWSNGMGSIGAYSSSGTLTFSNVIGNDIYLAYLGWGTNYGGTIALSIDGSSVTNFSTASVAYGNREYVFGSDAVIPDHVGPYGNGKIDFCPQLIRATDLGAGAHTVVVTASSAPVYVLWCAGNGFGRTIRKGPNVFVGTIPRQSPWTAGGTDALHAAFNLQLQQAVLSAKASGLRVALAPVVNDYLPATMQSGDGVHPTDAGHTAIAGAFEKTFSTDIPAIIASAASASSSSGSGGAGSFSSLAVSGTSTLTGNTTVNSRLLVLPTAISTSGGYNSRFGYGTTAASSVSLTYGDSTLDRALLVSGDRIYSIVNSSGADAGMYLGRSGQSVGIEGNIITVGSASIGTTLGVTGASTLTGAAVLSSTLAVAGQASFNGGANFAKTLSSSSGTDIASTFAYTINQSGSASSYGLFISPTQTALGSGVHRPLVISPGGTNRFYIEQTGRPVIVSPNGTTGALFRGDGATDSQIILNYAQTLDRRLVLAGNSVSVTDAAGSVAQNLSLGTSGNNVAVQGSASVGQNLTVTGTSSFTDTATFTGAIVANGGISYNRTFTGSSGTETVHNLQYTVNQTGTASSRGMSVALTSTALGSGTHRLLSMSDDGTERFYVQHDGRLVIVSPNGTSGILFRGDASTNSQFRFDHAATLDRQMVFSGNQIYVRDAGTGSTANTLALGESGSTVAIQGPMITPALHTIGTTGASSGALALKGDISGTVNVSVASAAGTHTIKLPTADGSVNQVLKTDGSGQWGWATPSSGSVASDSIWDAVGDVAYGTGANTAAVLTAPTGVIPSVMHYGPNGIEWVNSSTHFIFREEFLLSTTWQNYSSGGSGYAANSTAQTAGVWEIATGTASSTGRQLIGGGSAATVLGEGEVWCTWRIKIPTLSNGTDRFNVMVGLIDSDGVTDGVYFRYSDNENSGNWTYNTESNTSVTTGNTSTAVGTGWVNLTINVNAAGTQARFYVGGTLVGTYTGSTIPTGAARITAPGVSIIKTAGTASARVVDVDFVDMYEKFTTAR